VRILLQLVVVLSGLLMAREFMAHSNEHLRLVIRWAKVVSERIAAVHEPPALVAPVAVARIAEVSAQSIATVHEPPALVAPVAVARIAEVSAQSIATVHEPPALVAPMAVARIAEVSAQSIATVHEPPALVAPMTECEQIWDQMTHMTREEWAEACRRVDELRLLVRSAITASRF
jgi:hypothetical protein